MAAGNDSYERYLSDFEAASIGGDSPEWLGGLRRQAIESFGRVGFPTQTRGNERWKYTNVGPLSRSTFSYSLDVDTKSVSLEQVRALAPWDDGWTTLVFVDGVYAPTLSRGEGVAARSMARTVASDGAVVGEHLGRYASIQDGFIAVNTAFTHDGAVVEVPDGADIERPVHLVFVSSGASPDRVSYPRVLVLAGRNSRLALVDSYVGPSDGRYFTNAVVEIAASEGAEVEHYRYIGESPRAFHIGATRTSLDTGASYTCTSVATGARIARNDLSVLMDAPGASCVLRGLYSTSGSQHIDNHIDIDHAKPGCKSDQYFKGILDGRSRAVFSGRVLVRKDAQKSEAHQSDKNLILSEGARINTKPSLEIYADDIQATHGATAGAVADDALFYMRSRGIDEDTARRLLVSGFAAEILDTIPLDALREHAALVFSGQSTHRPG
jgi:Fe-S cluster assembly protein SufD